MDNIKLNVTDSTKVYDVVADVDVEVPEPGMELRDVITQAVTSRLNHDTINSNSTLKGGTYNIRLLLVVTQNS